MKISEVVAKRFVAHGFAYHREEVAAITITGEVESDAATLVQQAPQPFVQQLMVVDPVQSGIGEGNIKTFAQPQFSDIHNDEAQIRTQVCNRSVDHAATSSPTAAPPRGHSEHAILRFCSTRLPLASRRRWASSSGTASPRPKYISSGV